VRQLANALQKYEDANPEVGMPAMWWMHVNRAIEQLGLTKEDVDYVSLVGKDVAKRFNQL
jgi:hypothetical protein